MRTEDLVVFLKVHMRLVWENVCDGARVGPSEQHQPLSLTWTCAGASPEAAGGVVEDVFLRWSQRKALTQRNQDFLRQHLQSFYRQLLLQAVSGGQVPQNS